MSRSEHHGSRGARQASSYFFSKLRCKALDFGSSKVPVEIHHFFCSSQAFGTVADVPEHARYASEQDLGAFADQAEPEIKLPPATIPPAAKAKTKVFRMTDISRPRDTFYIRSHPDRSVCTAEIAAVVRFRFTKAWSTLQFQTTTSTGRTTLSIGNALRVAARRDHVAPGVGAWRRDP
jgi:hypothetical protein